MLDVIGLLKKLGSPNILCLLFLHLCFSLAFADDKDWFEIVHDDKKKGCGITQEGHEQDSEEKTVMKISSAVTYIIQGTNNANGDELTREGEDSTDGAYSMDLGFEADFDEHNRAYIHVETGDNAGVEDDIKVFSNVNRDADASDNAVSITEAWIEHREQTIPVSITAGKIDPTCFIDTNKYANDETAQFLSHIFRNSPTIEFPDNSLGIRFGIDPLSFLAIEFIAMDGSFSALQFNFKPNFFDKPGNYRFFGWVNDNADDNTSGFGLSFDQEITDDIGLFFRYAWQNNGVNLEDEEFFFEQSYSMGIEIAGGLWGREADYLGFAFGEVFSSADHSEKHLELYYNFEVNKHLHISPNIQIILDPYGGDAVNGDSPILILGIRAHVDF